MCEDEKSRTMGTPDLSSSPTPAKIRLQNHKSNRHNLHNLLKKIKQKTSIHPKPNRRNPTNIDEC